MTRTPRRRVAGRGRSPEGSAPLEPGELRNKAIRLLARRERSAAEMRELLSRHVEDPALVEPLLDELKQRGWLSETRLASQVVASRRSRASAARIRQELERRGIDSETVEEAAAGLDQGDLAVAVALWRRRFGRPASDRAGRERQIRFLLHRGFSHGVALKVLRLGLAEEDSGEAL